MSDTVSLEIQDRGQALSVVIHKMNAFQAEQWMTRAALLLGERAKELRGFTAADILPLICSVKHADLQPLLDELLACCRIKLGALEKEVTPGAALVQSPLTLLRLRVESFKANFGFLTDELAFVFRELQASGSPA